MKPVIYNSMAITIDVAENGLVVELSVFNIDNFDSTLKKRFVATSNTEALDFIRELSITGVGKLGTDVPNTDPTTDLDQIKTKIRAWWHDHSPCTGHNDLDDLFATL